MQDPCILFHSAFDDDVRCIGLKLRQDRAARTQQSLDVFRALGFSTCAAPQNDHPTQNTVLASQERRTLNTNKPTAFQPWPSFHYNQSI